MNIKRKTTIYGENSWMVDSLSPDERKTAEFVAAIAASIQRQRHVKGYTQKDLADKLGVSQVMISRWENGEENFTVATLAKISSALEMELHNPFESQAV
jgi:ribosome-binding protein aMBF1 (putative translation factor)